METTIGKHGFPDDEGRLRHSVVVALASCLTLVTGVVAQETVPLLQVDAELDDFGVVSVDEVRRGRIALVHDPAGPRIALHSLWRTSRATPPAPAVVDIPDGATGSPSGPGLKALWVWNTDELLRDVEERTTFLDFVRAQGIDRVFLHLPAAEGERARAGYVPFDGDALAPLLSALHGRGALAYALDGDPDYVHEENRAGVLRTVRSVAEHNRGRPPEERFHGVRYDVEPYLVRGFQGPRRAQILADYVRLLTDIGQVARAEGLAFGADVPFWFDAGDEDTGEPFEAVLDGEVRPVLDHVMAAVDDVAIMAYRTTASGPDGVLVHSAGEVGLGQSTGSGVFVGVETTHLYDEELFTFRGAGRSGMPELRDATWVFLEDRGDGRVRVSLADGEAALAELERETPDTRSLRYWFAGQPVPLPGDRLSFYSLGAAAMDAVTGEIVRRFDGDPAFLGLAYHDYRGLRALLER